MEISWLISALETIASESAADPEYAHIEADRVLLDFINDDGVYAAFDKVEKLY